MYLVKFIGQQRFSLYSGRTLVVQFVELNVRGVRGTFDFVASRHSYAPAYDRFQYERSSINRNMLETERNVSRVRYRTFIQAKKSVVLAPTKIIPFVPAGTNVDFIV